MADSLEKENLETWLRRPSIFVANAWYLLAAAGLYILPWLWSVLGSVWPGLTPLLQAMTSPVYNLCLLAFPAAMYAANRPGVSQAMRLKRPRWYECVEACALAGAAVVLCGCLSGWWTLLLEAIGGHVTPSEVSLPDDWAGAASTMLSLALLPAACEELLLRGGILGAWERRGTMYGLCVSSVLFCALHGSIQGMPTQLLMGFTLGLLAIRSGSLIPGMLCHGGFNALSLLLGRRFSGEVGLTMAQQIARFPGYTGLIVATAASAFVFGALLMMFLAHRAGEPLEQVKNGDREQMQWDELLLLIAGLMTVAVRYGVDLMTVCGL